MSKYKQDLSKETIQEAIQIARGNQRPGQTKEQTKLIAQGIQKGIEQYKKKHKTRSRQLDKKLNAVKSSLQQEQNSPPISENNQTIDTQSTAIKVLPWTLLIGSWLIFLAFYLSG